MTSLCRTPPVRGSEHENAFGRHYERGCVVIGTE